MQGTPQIALVLSSGAARGFAHTGVLEVLDAAGIRPNLIVGASFGGLVGAAYAAGRSPAEMAEITHQIDLKTMLGFTDPKRPWDGLVAGERLEAFFADLVGHADFDSLRTPTALVATDLNTGFPVVLNQGDVARAIRASTAIPGIFAPVRWGDRVLVDGSLSSGLPIWAVDSSGPWVIIAVDVTSDVDARSFSTALRKVSNLPWMPIGSWETFLTSKPERTPQIVWTLLRSASLLERDTETQLDSTSSNLILIRPAVQNVRWFEFTNGDEIRRLGIQAALQALPQIERVLALQS